MNSVSKRTFNLVLGGIMGAMATVLGLSLIHIEMCIRDRCCCSLWACTGFPSRKTAGPTM